MSSRSSTSPAIRSVSRSSCAHFTTALACQRVRFFKAMNCVRCCGRRSRLSLSHGPKRLLETQPKDTHSFPCQKIPREGTGRDRTDPECGVEDNLLYSLKGPCRVHSRRRANVVASDCR
ncbi:hypothetical protein BV22DRAFT_82762 [Leucogyrophana mollusca]|uniref:Uncharacterized protein n=1 Tax=Leucogyrophana mollusca TaxID=85980 RepID=A0ACB8BX44_9AGAM|nr:hypothetical protein BV22DRAFT_82762 [Leucogyrophana mollusca]